LALADVDQDHLDNNQFLLDNNVMAGDKDHYQDGMRDLILTSIDAFEK